MSTRCFAMLKPGVLNRRLVGEVISRLEKKGLKLVGLKLMNISPELAAEHYAEHKGKAFYDPLVDYITSGPVVAMVWQGDDCVPLVRKMTGATNPADAMPATATKARKGKSTCSSSLMKSSTGKTRAQSGTRKH